MDMASSSSSSIQKTERTSSMEMEQLNHFSHEHVLRLVQLQPDYVTENSDNKDEDEDGDEDEDNIVVPEDCRVGSCKMCEEDIYSFHLCYHSCKDCDYSLHTFCAQLPITQQNHHLHPGHNLILSKNFVLLSDPSLKFAAYVKLDEWRCTICELEHKTFYGYHCSSCFFHMDIICATLSERKMDHPSHPHQLQRCSRMISISRCNACGKEHSGTFYNCTTCSCFMINLHCALLPPKLLIQQSTNGSFSHSHLLTLTYSFPFTEVKAKFFPQCRVCDKYFFFEKWHYRCDKCRCYVHVECATLPRDAYMSSILMPAGLGKTSKNFKDDDHPNLIRCPFPDESFNLLKHLFTNEGKLNIKSKIDGEKFSHPHMLSLFETLDNEHVSLHDPMKQVELLCDGCVRPITDLPFYKCSQDDCGFVLHEWCTRLPPVIKDHYGHPNHPLVLQPKIRDSFGVFVCDICMLVSNGFTYRCMQCEYYVDINCAFIPDVITHEAHPDHLLQRIEASPNLPEMYCRACRYWLNLKPGFHCPTCDFYLHTMCALLLPGKIRHKYDKHSLSLRYYPAENHSSAYFCEICEDEFNPKRWFYHCSTCASSMHTACAPLKLHYERFILPSEHPVFMYLNVKFGRTFKITDHPHPLTFVQGLSADGKCDVCHEELQPHIIFKCSQCKLARHIWCV